LEPLTFDCVEPARTFTENRNVAKKTHRNLTDMTHILQCHQ